MTEPHIPSPSDSASLAPTLQDPESTREPEGRGFWQIIGRAFFRSLLNRLALSFLLLIIAVAVFVPFLANGRPYTVVIDGHRSYPLFRALTRVDLIVLFLAACATVYALAHRRLRRIPEVAERRARQARWFLALLALATAGSVAVALLKTDVLDSRDYRALVADGSATHAVFAPLAWGYADQEPLQANLIFDFPTSRHVLGTDGNGRDALARLLWSTRIVLGIGLIAEVISLLIGVTYGALMGYFVGTVDILGMRFVEVVEAIPTLFLLITFVALYGRNIFMLMVILGLTGWTGIARFTRAEFLRLRNLDYVMAAKACGLPLRSILFRHMLPNGLTPVIVTFTFGVASAVSFESILSFLGLGVEPPTPSWGSMLNEAGNPAEVFRWWLAIAPGLMIFLTVFAYNIIGEGLRDAIDPRLNKQVE